MDTCTSSRYPNDKSRHPEDKSKHQTDKSKHPTEKSKHARDKPRHKTPNMGNKALLAHKGPLPVGVGAEQLSSARDVTLVLSRSQDGTYIDKGDRVIWG